MMLLDATFGTAGDVSVLQECARAVLVFADGLLALRIAGRRIFAQWNALDIVLQSRAHGQRKPVRTRRCACVGEPRHQPSGEGGGSSRRRCRVGLGYAPFVLEPSGKLSELKA